MPSVPTQPLRTYALRDEPGRTPGDIGWVDILIQPEDTGVNIQRDGGRNGCRWEVVVDVNAEGMSVEEAEELHAALADAIRLAAKLNEVTA